MPTALLIRQVVRSNRVDTLRAFVIDQARKRATDGIESLLRQSGALTVMVFLEQGEFGPALWWYVELTGTADEVWTDPEAEMRKSPLFEAGLRSTLISNNRPECTGQTGSTAS